MQLPDLLSTLEKVKADDFDSDQLRQLVDLLWKCEHMNRKSDREVVVKDLPEHVRRNVIVADNQKDLFAIRGLVDACLNHRGGLKELIKIVSYYEQESEPFLAVKDYLERFSQSETLGAANPESTAPSAPALIIQAKLAGDSIFAPDVGVKPAHLSSRCVFRLGEAHEPIENWPSFDLGMIWGISRGSFIGITSAEESSGLYDYLVTLEKTLLDSQQGLGKSAFATRWWLQLDMEHNLNGPASLTDIWSAANKYNPERVARLREWQLFPNGFVIRVEAARLADDTLFQISSDWCGSLLHLLPSKQLTIIFQIAADSTAVVRQRLSLLEEKLKRLSKSMLDSIPVEIMLPDRFARGRDTSSTNLSPPKACFASWVSQIGGTYRRQVRGSRDEDARDISALEEIGAMCASQETITPCSAKDVVVDIDNFAAPPSTSEQLDSRFLRMVKRYLPERMNSLVEEYTWSRRANAPRLALAIAADSDTLLDAWIKGAFDEENQEGPAVCLQYINDKVLNVECIESLVLALMRNYSYTLAKDALKQCVEACLKKLSWAENIQHIWELCRELVEGDQKQLADRYTSFLQEDGYSEERVRLLVRAKLHFDERLPLSALKPFLDFDHPDSWWLLMSLPPTRERLRQFHALKLGMRQQAVMGLCTPEEWRVYGDDQVLREKLLTCRYGRDLCFRTPEAEKES